MLVAIHPSFAFISHLIASSHNVYCFGILIITWQGLPKHIVVPVISGIVLAKEPCPPVILYSTPNEPEQSSLISALHARFVQTSGFSAGFMLTFIFGGEFPAQTFISKESRPYMSVVVMFVSYPSKTFHSPQGSPSPSTHTCHCSLSAHILPLIGTFCFGL